MPKDNNFQHAKYSRADPGERVEYKSFEPGAGMDSPAWGQVMSKVGAQLLQSRVRGVLFVNGYPYVDLFGAARLDEVGGLKRGYSRGISGLESLLALLRPESNEIVEKAEAIRPPVTNEPRSHEQVDRVAQEVGNFTTAYVQHFHQAINQNVGPAIPCARYLWSSSHHHLGRVEAAIDLMAFLQEWGKSLSVSSDDRILIFAHGHAGQVLALLSNLVTKGESEARPRVFEILANYWEANPSGENRVAQLEDMFASVSSKNFLEGGILDVVTLGTPIRYGWDTDGVGNLLHVLNHRPIRGDGKKWLAKMELPGIAFEMPYLMGGDYVQQLAIAGTDALPETPEAEQANLEFRELFEPYDGFERWLECTRKTTRCPNEGNCLLVDYGVGYDQPSRTHLFGHGCYTQSRGMLFTALETIKSFY